MIAPGASTRREAADSRKPRPWRRRPSRPNRRAGARTAGRKRLDDIERAKQQKSEQQSGPPDGNHEQRDQHAHHFIDHDRAWIDASQIFFARPRQHRPGTQQHDDEHELEIQNREVRQARYTASPAAEPTVPGANGKKPMYPKLQMKTARRRIPAVALRRRQARPRGCARGDRAARDDRRSRCPAGSRHRAAAPTRYRRACEAWPGRSARARLPGRSTLMPSAILPIDCPPTVVKATK